MLGMVDRLIADGHELAGIFSFQCDNVFNFNSQSKELAEELDIPFSIGKPLPMDIKVFTDQGTQVFLAAGYPHKIPHIDEDYAYGLNLHPSLLPQGRGLMPTPTIIINSPDICGFTIHKLTQIFDDGDILIQKPINLTDQDDVETLSARIAMAAPEAISKVFKNLPSMWQNAWPQDKNKASTFPVPDDQMRLLDWNKPVSRIMKTGKAFGRFGCLARVNGKLLGVYNFNVWEEHHNQKPGNIVCVLSREIVIAASDGYVCLKEFQELS